MSCFLLLLPCPSWEDAPTPRGVPPSGCSSQGATASAAPAVSLGQTVRGFLGRYGQCLIRKLPCALRYDQYKSRLIGCLRQPPRVRGKPAASCCWRGARGARLVPAASVRPAPASPPPHGAGPAPLFGDSKGNLSCIPHSRCSPAVSRLTYVRLVTATARPCVRWNDEGSRWMTWAAARRDALQVQTILDKGLEQNSDLNCTNATNCTPDYSYLQFLRLLVKKTEADIGLYCISYCMT